MTIDWTISIGNLLTILIIVLGGIGAYYNLKGDVKMLKHDFNGLKVAMTSLSTTAQSMTELLTKVAVQDERFNAYDSRLSRNEQDMADLRRGDGFILNPTRGHPVSK